MKKIVEIQGTKLQVDVDPERSVILNYYIEEKGTKHYNINPSDFLFVSSIGEAEEICSTMKTFPGMQYYILPSKELKEV
jgi:hypothetical protein